MNPIWQTLFGRLLTLVGSVIAAGSLEAAISVGATGVGPLTFDTAPTVGEFSTGYLTGVGATVTTNSEIDNYISQKTVAAISNVCVALRLSSIVPPSAVAYWFQYNTSNHYLQSRPTTSNAPQSIASAGLIMLATLQNDSGRSQSNVTVSYDMGVTDPAVGELPGYRAFFNVTGAASGWQLIPEFSSIETNGRVSALLNLGIWASSSQMYILWVDDNANGVTDPGYTIDNFQVALPVDTVALVSSPANAVAEERQSVTLHVGATGASLQYQWYHNDIAMENLSFCTNGHDRIITGARGANLVFNSAEPGDAGQYRCVVTNFSGSVTSLTATLTVHQDTTPPRIRFAYPGSSSRTIVLYLSEPLNDSCAPVGGGGMVTKLSTWRVEELVPGLPSHLLGVDSFTNTPNIMGATTIGLHLSESPLDPANLIRVTVMADLADTAVAQNSIPAGAEIYVTALLQQAYLKASNPGSADYFGWRVAISGDTLVVAALLEDSGSVGVNGDPNNENGLSSGAAYVFVRNGTNWVQQAYLKPSNTPVCNAFGQAVAVDGDTVVIGAYGESSNATGVNGNQNDNSAFSAGAAYVFVRTGTNWTQQAYLKASNTEGSDSFGSSVAVSGGTVVVGAYLESSSAIGVNGNQSDNSATWAGAAYVFVRNGTNWSQQAYLKSANSEQFGQFGESAGVSGNTIVIGANGENGASGAAYIFVRNGTNWSQQTTLRSSNLEEGDNFGTKVAISGNTVAVAARYEDSNATGMNGDSSNNSSTDSGAAYVFVRNGTTWSQQAYLKASNPGPGDDFGASISVSGDLLVVGAPMEDSNVIGINGNQSDNSATNSGGAYVYVRVGTNWSQRAYLKASNTGQGDFFGRGVGVSGDTVVVGAYSEDSNANGINGDQNNNGLTDSGAAYVYTGFATRPHLTVVSDHGGGYVVTGSGEPDVTYRLQRATSLSGPWTALRTVVAPASGVLEFHDTTAPPSQAFYRTVEP